MSPISLLLLLLLILFSIPLLVMGLARRGYGKTAVPSGPTGGGYGKPVRSGPEGGDSEGDVGGGGNGGPGNTTP